MITPVDDAAASAEAVGERLLLLAEADPEAAHDAATKVLRRSGDCDRVLEVHARRALGVSLRVLQRYTEAKVELDLALALALAADDLRLAGLVRISRAPCSMWLGDEDAAAEDLAIAVAVLRGVDRAVARFQHASFRQQYGSTPEADRELDSAIRVLRRSDRQLHRLYEAHALTNRGLDRVYRGEMRRAGVDLQRARELYVELDLRSAAADALQNLSFHAASSGDIVGALAHLTSASAELSALGRPRGILDLDYARHLLNAGLADEALERAEMAAAELAAEADVHQLPYADYVAALAHAQLGHTTEAHRRARAAQRGFTRRGRGAWALAAELVAVACAPVSAATARKSQVLATRLDVERRSLDAARARVLAGELLAAINRPGEAREVIEPIGRRALPPELRVGVCTVQALAAVADGNRAGFLSWARRGLEEVGRYQGGFASAEIRWAIGRHAATLLTAGHDDAMKVGGVARRFRWIELARANAIRHAPVTRPADQRLSALLDELRNVTQRRTSGPDSRLLMQQEQRLERAIAERERALRVAEGRVDLGTVVRLGDLQAVLGDRTLMQFDVIDERLTAIRITARRAEARDIAPVADAIAIFAALRRTVNQLAALGPGDDARHHAMARLNRLAERADVMLMNVGASDGAIVIVPPPELANAPWALVPRLARAAITVASSATVWCTAALAPPDPREDVLLVAGAGLRHAAAEVEALADVYARARTLVGPDATAAGVRVQLPRARVAHFATHHQHRRANPLFGSLELADGPLFLHDILGLPSLPSLVVLSACEAASGDRGPIGDVLGATTVLMERGTRTVLASPTLVADTAATSGAMTHIHRLLRRGTSPAEALLAARDAADRDDPAAGLIGSYLSMGAG